MPQATQIQLFMHGGFAACENYFILFASVMSGEEQGSSAMQHRLQSKRLRGILCLQKPGQALRKAGPELSRTIQGNTLALGNRTQAQLGS